MSTPGGCGIFQGSALVFGLLICSAINLVQGRDLQQAQRNGTVSPGISFSQETSRATSWASPHLDGTVDARGSWRSEDAYYLKGTNFDWRPLVVLAVGETLGYIVRGVTGEYCLVDHIV